MPYSIRYGRTVKTWFLLVNNIVISAVCSKSELQGTIDRMVTKGLLTTLENRTTTS